MNKAIAELESIYATNGFVELKKQPLEPLDFCKKWVNSDPEKRGYYRDCVRALSKVTTLSERSIERWGPDFSKRPRSVLATLRKEDMLNEVRVALGPVPDYLAE